jgi:hypothetical protein
VVKTVDDLSHEDLTSYFLHFLSDLDKIRWKNCPNVLSDSEFRENRLCESRLLLEDVN